MKLLILMIPLLLAACETPESKPASATSPTQPAEENASGEGEVCGTIANTRCQAGLFCDIDDPSVGLDQRGSCRAKPEQCPDIALETPLCGRDGVRYPTECHANMNGTDIVTVGADTHCG